MANIRIKRRKKRTGNFTPRVEIEFDSLVRNARDRTSEASSTTNEESPAVVATPDVIDILPEQVDLDPMTSAPEPVVGSDSASTVDTEFLLAFIADDTEEIRGKIDISKLNFVQRVELLPQERGEGFLSRTVESLRRAWESYTYPRGFQQTKRAIKREARRVIDELGSFADITRISEVGLVEVVNAVKCIIPYAEPSRANMLVAHGEILKAMAEKGYSPEYSHSVVWKLVNWVFIPNSDELTALIHMNSGPTQAYLQMRREINRGASLRGWSHWYSSRYNMFPSYQLGN